MADLEFLDADNLISIHAAGVAEIGDWGELADAKALDSAVNAVKTFEFYDQNADVFDCAAAYAFYVVKAHAFTNGNKRAAFMSSLVFLRINGLTAEFPDSDLAYRVVMALTEDRITREEFAALLSNASIRDWITEDDLDSNEGRDDLIASLAGIDDPAEVRARLDAWMVDHCTSAVRRILIERCESFGVRGERVADFPTLLESKFYPRVRADLRKEFGMD